MSSNVIKIFVCTHVLTQCLADRINGFCFIECVKNLNVVHKTIVPCFVASSIASMKNCKIEILTEK